MPAEEGNYKSGFKKSETAGLKMNFDCVSSAEEMHETGCVS